MEAIGECSMQTTTVGSSCQMAYVGVAVLNRSHDRTGSHPLRTRIHPPQPRPHPPCPPLNVFSKSLTISLIIIVVVYWMGKLP